LLTIRERIELLGGRMKIRSAVGRGSTFLIAVPDGDPRDATRGARGEGREGGEARGARDEAGTPVPRPSGPTPLRVLLVDDHKITRQGLAALLGEQSDLEVVGEAGNGREAIHLASQLRPDVIVMDVAMPVMAGDEVTRQIKRHWPGVRIIALSMFEEANLGQTMRAAGAEAYLLKTAPSDAVLAAIRGGPSPV
jgi:CheY-like chemotaxis protein